MEKINDIQINIERIQWYSIGVYFFIIGSLLFTISGFITCYNNLNIETILIFLGDILFLIGSIMFLLPNHR